MKLGIPFFKLILSFLLLSGTTLSAFAQVQELSSPVKSGVNRMTKFGEQLIAYEANGNKSIYKLDVTTQQWVNISNPPLSDIRSSYNLNTVAGQGDYLFAGFDNVGIYRSDDLGESWLKTSNGIEDESIYTIKYHNDEIYIGTYSGIFKSSNDGISWTEFSSNFTSFQLDFRMIHFIDGHIYTATYNGLYSTQDNGTSWQSADAGLASTFEPNQMFEFSGLQFVAGYDQEVLKLARRNDHVSDWEEATSDIALDTVEVINYEVIDNQLLALSDKGFFQYDVQNYSWTPITIDTAGYTTQRFFSDGQDLYRMTGFDLFRASLTEVWASNETQIDWTRNNEGFATLPVHDLLKFNGKLYAGTSNGIFETNAEEQPYDWHITSNEAAEIKSLFHFDTLLLAASETNVYVSTDSAQSWSSTLAQETFQVYSFEGNLYAATFDGVYISEDTAKTWYPSNIGLNSNEAYEFAAIGSTLFVRSSDDIYRSTDKGIIWESLNVRTKVNEDIYFGNPVSLSASTDQLFASFASEKLVQSGDLGESWLILNDTQQDDYSTIQLSKLSAAQQNLIACISSSNNTLAFSLNNGQSWNHTPLSEEASTQATIHSLFMHEGKVCFSINGQFYGFDTETLIIPSKPVLTEVALDKGMNDYSQPTMLNLKWEVNPETEQVVVKSLTSYSNVDIHYADASLGQDSISYNSTYSNKLAVYAVKNNIFSEPYIIMPLEEWPFVYTHSYYEYSANSETEKKYLRWGIAKDYDTDEVITDTVQIFVSSDNFQTNAEGYDGYITNGVAELESEIGEGNKADWLDVPGGIYKGKVRYKKGIYFGGFTNFEFEAPERPQDQEEVVLSAHDEFTTAQRIDLYPNPTENNKLYLNVSGLNARQLEAEIFNAVGNKVRSKTLKSEGTQLTHTFELSGLPAGIYFIKLNTNNHSDTIRFIKKD